MGLVRAVVVGAGVLCWSLVAGAQGHPELARPTGPQAVASHPAAFYALVRPGGPDWPQLQSEALSVLQQYLRIDTSNAGVSSDNGERAAQLLAAVLQRHGIEVRLIPIRPGWPALYARLRGDGARRPLILLSHIDVVPAGNRGWTRPPYAGDIYGGELYGRGTVDTKSLGIEELFTLIALKESGRPLHRDVILLATPDEENGGRWGAGWLVRHRLDLFAGAEYLIDEGGGVEQFGDRDLVSIEVTQKTPLWVRIVATGAARHAATPPVDDAVGRLLDGLGRIRQMPLPPGLTPQAEQMLQTLAPEMLDERLRRGFAHPAAVLDDAAFWRVLRENPGYGWYNALLRSTVTITRLQGSRHINTIPAEASAELDCRLLPGVDAQTMLSRLRAAAGDPAHIRIEVLLNDGGAPASSPATDLYRAMAAASRRAWPGALLLPSLSPGFTDSRFFRRMGVECYGWDPVELTEDEAGRAHSNNERIRPEAFQAAIPVLYDAVRQVVQ